VLVSLHASATGDKGWGHYFRLSALGEELVRRGHDVFFCLETDDRRLSARLRSLGIEWVTEDDLLTLRTHSLAVVDDYQPNLQLVSALEVRGTRIAQIIDSGSTLRIPGALVVRPDPLFPDDGDLSGLRYALISSDVSEFVGDSIVQGTPVVSIVVGGAGGDVEGEIERALIESGRCTVMRLRDRMPADLVDRSDYLRVLSSSAVCVCGAGTTLWECAALGVPAVAVIVAENQREQAKWAHANGLCVASEGSEVDLVVRSVELLIRDPERRLSMARQGRLVVDTNGPKRVAEFLERMTELSLRKCSLEDAHQMFDWRASDRVNRWMFSDPPTSIESHRAWLLNQLAREDKWMWIIELHGRPIGLVSLERSRDSEYLDLGIYVAEKSSSGTGRTALVSALGIAKSRGLGVGVRADVFSDNSRAINLYETVGFEKVSTRISPIMKSGVIRDVARFELMFDCSSGVGNG